MKATGFIVAAVFNLIVYIVVLGVIFFSGNPFYWHVAADLALEQIEESSRALAEKHRARALQPLNVDRVSPVDWAERASDEVQMAADVATIADVLAPVARRELRAHRRLLRVLSIAAPVMAFSPVVVVFVLPYVRGLTARSEPGNEKQTPPNDEQADGQ